MKIWKTTELGETLSGGSFFPTIYFEDWKLRIFKTNTFKNNFVQRLREENSLRERDDVKNYFYDYFELVIRIPKSHWCVQRLTAKEIARLKVKGILADG